MAKLPFFKRFSRSSSKALVPFTGKPATKALEELVDINHVNKSLREQITKKPFQDAALAAGVGGLGGALLPADGPKSLSEKQKKKNAALTQWWRSLSHFERMDPKNQKKLETGFASTSGRKRVERGFAGGLLGGMLGLYTGYPLRALRVQNVARRFNDAVSDVFQVRNGSFAVMGPRAERHILEQAGDYIKKMPGDIPVGGASVSRRRAYEVLMNPISFPRGDLERFMPPNLRRRLFTQDELEAAEALKNSFLGEFAGRVKSGPDTGVSGIVNTLRAQGVKDAKDFVKAYHPDRNKNVPPHIAGNFGQILNEFRGGTHTSSDELQQLVDRISKSNQEKVEQANKIVRPILKKNWKPN